MQSVLNQIKKIQVIPKKLTDLPYIKNIKILKIVSKNEIEIGFRSSFSKIKYLPKGIII